MVALATDADVVARLGRPLSTDEEGRVLGLIDEASVIVTAHLGCDVDALWPTTGDVPQGVRVVVSRMVARVLAQAEVPGATSGATSSTTGVGPFSRTHQWDAGTTSGAPWLGATDKLSLRPYRCGGGMVAVSLGSDATGRHRDPYRGSW